ncbi:uncharacterized protein LOC119464850 isoform X3 [Dermacentor silvarum]|uniref:uncharacterized protein LOC119464850 isoform X2 n=1 Tax=Dermacentor silvarum TaxID=543639 RepID=UPI0021014398|nr:uncharacterized protein LOC119464850 isoform X2 [Dermacentor silvarum]XP_049511777.1 uncharacterized protein LOC119464850 isoform X3 [Dermacentor silvarum]
MTGRPTSPPECGNLLFHWIYLWTFLVVVVLQPASAGLCSVGEALMSCNRKFLRPKGDNEVFMKAITACLEKEKLDLTKINLPCFQPKQVDTLVKCRCEAYVQAAGKKSSADAKKKTVDFKKCVDKAVKS